MIRRTSQLVAVVATLLAVVLVAAGCGGEDSRSPTGRTTVGHSAARGVDDESGLPFVAVRALPDEARDTLALIADGGPFRYDEDGSRFGNYEGILPAHRSGYYEEYTVGTPGSPDRGARRLVVGQEDEIYWTADHDSSFERVRP